MDTRQGNSHWSRFDTMWMVNLFGTAVGAGILFLPITAGQAGLWPIVLITMLVCPMTWLTHRGLARLVLASHHEGSDITVVVEEFFGRKAGTVITLLYFLAIYPILLIYGVSLTNTVASFMTNQLGITPPPRVVLSAICIGACFAVILTGEEFVLRFNEKLVFPLCAILLGLSLYLIPHWNLSQFAYVPGTKALLETLWMTLPVIVFAFSHAPAISTFALAQRKKYGDAAGAKASRTLLATSATLVVFCMFFVFSCVLSLSPQDMAAARVQNISVLSYLANHFNSPLIVYCGPFIAFLAICTSFFGHYLGAREGLNGLLTRALGNAPARSRAYNAGTTMFFFVTLWGTATLNPSVLQLIERLSGPVLAIILFLLPMYAVARIPAMQRYRGAFSNIFVTLMGSITVASLVTGLLAK